MLSKLMPCAVSGWLGSSGGATSESAGLQMQKKCCFWVALKELKLSHHNRYYSNLI